MARPWTKIVTLAALLAVTAALTAGAQPSAEPGQPLDGPVWAITLADSVNPGSVQFVSRSLDQAVTQRAALVVLVLDTPGGLVDSMRLLVKDILASPSPVAVFVAPAGARATSAGAFLVLAGHVAAMAPASHLGAAAPVSGGGGEIEGTMAKKAVSDLAALAAGLAKRRGRDPALAQAMVTEAKSHDVAQALDLKLIDLRADDLPDLLRKLEGRVVQTGDGPRTIRAAGRPLRTAQPDWRDRLLSFLASPNLAYILLMIGLAGLYFELSQPGAIVPGVIGALSLILALFAMSALPVSYAGLALIGLAVVLFIAEIKVISHGLLSLGGAICLLLGSLMLFDAERDMVRVSTTVLAPILASVIAFFAVVAYLAGKAQRTKGRTGMEGLIGQRGRVDDRRPCWVRVQGELWRAPGATGLAPGSPVVVRAVDGLELVVEPIDETKAGKA